MAAKRKVAERLDETAFVLGMLAAPLMFVYSIGGALGAAAAVSGSAAITLAPKDDERGMAIFGGVLGAIAFLVTLVYLLVHGRVFLA